ncbi:glycoside hydrolase family 61 protein [Daldinia eschscholtzii]|nr:glycoside hydrolase family 61 protein [Daldinia eschscholtzii]
MKNALPLGFVASLLANGALGHYAFTRIRVNGTVTGHWQYVRNLTTGYEYSPDGQHTQWAPYYDIYDENIRCGRGAAIAHPGIETATVIAGENVSFVIGASYEGENRTIYHEGVGQAYLSYVEDGKKLEDYRGDGDWFKIDEIPPLNQTKWPLLGLREMTFTIPKTTPPGKYLMRGEQVFPFSSQWNTTQFYISCAHINVVGPGGGTPGPMARFPGAYDLFDPSIWVPHVVGDFPPKNLTGYIGPGPSVWKG